MIVLAVATRASSSISMERMSAGRAVLPRFPGRARPIGMAVAMASGIAPMKTRIGICAIWSAMSQSLRGHPWRRAYPQPPWPSARKRLLCYPRFPRMSRLAGDFARSYIRPEPAPGAFASNENGAISKTPGDRHSPARPRLRIRLRIGAAAWSCGGLKLGPDRSAERRR